MIGIFFYSYELVTYTLLHIFITILRSIIMQMYKEFPLPVILFLI